MRLLNYLTKHILVQTRIMDPNNRVSRRSLKHLTDYRSGSSIEELRPWRSDIDISTLERIFPRIVSLAKTLVQKHNKLRKENNTAITLFCLEQVRIVSGCYLNHMDRNCNCNHNDLSDLMLNLVTLHRRMRHRFPETAQPLAADIRRLFVILEEIDQAIRLSINQQELEHLDNYDEPLRGIQNWKEVAEHLVATSPLHLEQTWHIPRIIDFQLIRVLGAGGFGAVFLVKYKPADLLCALKAVSIAQLAIDRAHMDKTVASITRSPHLATLYASFVTRDAFVSVMEYADGVDLFEVIRVNIDIHDPRLLRIIAVQCVRAIEHIHLNGIIHRDIKPPNMLINAQAHVKLIDMDLARVCIGNFLRRPMSIYFRSTHCEVKDPQRCGTPCYCAPELMLFSESGRSVDWWSLGISLFVMAFGLHPFRGKQEKLRRSICRDLLEIPLPGEPPGYYVYTQDFADFLVGLLTKVARKRLGSGSYTEIRNHPYMADLDVLLREGFDKNAIQKVFDDLYQDPDLLPENLPMKFEDIHDLEHMRKHQRLLTYCAPSFRRLLDNFRSGNLDATIELTPPSTGLDYNRPPVLSSHVPSSIQQFDHMSAMDTIVIEQPHMANGVSWNAGFRCRQVTDDQNQLFLMVTHIASRSPASKAYLICGDLIVTWNGSRINGNEFPERCQTSSITLEARYCNAFCFFRKCKNVYNQLAPHFQTLITISLEPVNQSLCGAKAYGFKTRLLKVWSVADNDYKVIHLVSFVDPVLRHGQGLYEGDIVCDLRPGGKFFDSERLTKSLGMIRPRGRITLHVAPFSILRSNNEMLSNFMEDVVISDRRNQLEEIFSPFYFPS